MANARYHRQRMDRDHQTRSGFLCRQNTRGVSIRRKKLFAVYGTTGIRIPTLGCSAAYELKDELQSLVTNLDLEIMDGDKVIEIKNSGINKGRAALSTGWAI